MGAVPAVPLVAQKVAVGKPMLVATAGLALVLLLLSVFAVAVSITNSRGTERAQRAASDSDLYEKASEALLKQEEAAEEVVAEDSAQTRADYTAANLEARAALDDLTPLTMNDPQVGDVDLLAAHARYAESIADMFAVAQTSPELAEPYEDAYVDPHFDPLAASLDTHVKSRYVEARAALTSIAQKQSMLRVATPALFSVGLLLLAIFIVMLVRSGRLVTEQADENRHQALHDQLTGLPNRTLLHQRGRICLQQAGVAGTPVALILLDLDRFKQINDTLGHHSGDLVLRAVAERLRTAVRASDLVVRLGGDEFAILLPHVKDAAGALAVAAKVQDVLRTSIDAAGVLLDVELSMGVAVSGVHGDDMETLLQHADIAMYRAKEHDLGVCVYDDELNEHSREQLGLLGELRRAIDSDELVLHFQPKVDVATGAFCGAEALLRWQHPAKGLIPPGMFIPAAERTALIRPLTGWVLNAALAECKRWQDEGQELRLSVNVSARNLLDPAFEDSVIELLARWELPSTCLLLEVTESAIMIDPGRAESILRGFARSGIELAIDDFGAGYTSLAHLRTLPVQELKIDQSLVRQMSRSPADALIIGAVIELAHKLGLRTVAEGVEDADTLRRLGDLDCDVAQGYYLARPMSATALSSWTRGRASSSGAVPT